MPIPIPPLEEQQKIAADVEERLSIAEASEGLILTNLLRATRMRQSILKDAFEGKLVPQDPNDEPASVLLERIRASRNGSADLVASGPAAKPNARKRKKTKS